MEQNILSFLMNHWALWLALCGILGLMAINEQLTQKKRPKTLSVTAAIESINHEQAVVVDLRNPDLFRTGHILDALCISADDQTRLNKYKNTLLLLVCARGVQSTALALKLRKDGFTHPMVLAGGMQAWLAANLPVIKNKKTNSTKKD